MNKTLEYGIGLIKNDYKDVLEFGVHHGGSIVQIRDRLRNKGYSIYGFDSFEGLPEDWEGTPLKKGSFSLGGVAPIIDEVKLYKGWFKDTIPEYIKIAKPISLLHIDCDLYSSTKEVLYGLKDFILSGTVIVFDEWYYNHIDIEENRQHEQKLFFEWVKDFNIKYEIHPSIEEERKAITIL